VRGDELRIARGGVDEVDARTHRINRVKKVFDLERYLKERAQIVERELARVVAEPAGAAARLFDAMRYSLLGGGKRLRPVLALAASEAVGGKLDAALGIACAVEMIHTYSLIHDDLPCMDDDDLRHGRPTSHKVYGEAFATLAGDALLTDAFKVLARSASEVVPPAVMIETIVELAEAAGSSGMVAGQTIDILGQAKTLAELEELHGKKTGAMFLASIKGGARIGGADAHQLKALDSYGRALGLAFQVIDDLLDVESTTEQLGKRTQKDAEQGKATYPGILGIERSHQFARQLEQQAHRALDSFDDRAEPLRQIATFVVERKL
jgi:geranylgeranyl diphosphate synthase, type II